ncbi:Alpha-ketoglutarate-dependent dioxygenase alkB 7, mitochondrial [Phlyctochytrium bullatum]|nr:Alpha-ketoglutarate-dependent dioxygenase alkB 7, mitochondrial [Phlyctochytrium bullatum]
MHATRSTIGHALRTAAPALRLKTPHPPRAPPHHARPLSSSPSPSHSPFLDLTSLPPHLHPAPGTVAVLPDFITPAEESLLVAAADARLRRLARGPYLESHFDNVIRGYKEASISSWALSEEQAGPEGRDVARVMDRMRARINEELGRWGRETVERFLPPHVLELRDKDSRIGAHVDNLEASGHIVAGLCLLSPAVAIFRHTSNPSTHFFKAHLPARCLYYQNDAVRYDFTHEIPAQDDPDHSFKGAHVDRARRLCILLRDELRRVQS